MKKINLLLLATLLAGTCMAATPTSVYTVGDASTLGAKWADKGQPSNYFEVEENVVFNALLCYQSVSEQTWIACTESGSSKATYAEKTPFPASSAWGTGDAGTKVANANTSRTYYFNVTNASAVLVYGNSTSDKRTLVVEAYELNADLTTVGEAIDTKNIAKEDAIVSIALDPAKTYQVQVSGSNSDNARFYGIAFTKAPAAKDDATLSAITINGEALEGFAPETTAYNVELPFGTTVVPVVAATPTSSKATVSVTQATAVNGKATIHVVAEDGTTTKDYTVQFSVAAAASVDATLASLSIDGKAIADFKADSLAYTSSVAYLYESIPVISAEANDESANVAITQATAIPGTATIVVTAQAGNKTTYTVEISRADAIKHLTVVPFSNGAKGAINESDLTVTVPYRNGTAVPTLVADSIQVSGDNTNSTKPTATCNADGTITLKGIDNKEAIYSVVTHPLSAIAMTENVVTFDSTELYIFAPYGWDAAKGWKFAKKVNDECNMRDAKGNTRIYMALPPSDSVQLTSGTSARAVVIYVNGAKSDVKETAASGKTITIALSSTTKNFVAFESNQTSVDGGFSEIQLFNPSEPIGSALDQTQVEAKATKVIRNGQLLIIREGKTYTVQGVEVK